MTGMGGDTYVGMHGGTYGGTYGGTHDRDLPPLVPATPHGKTLLNKTLVNLGLPPEEWAVGVKELSAELIECLEQLYERETELRESSGTISTLEDNLVKIKQQMAALYYDFSLRQQQWER